MSQPWIALVGLMVSVTGCGILDQGPVACTADFRFGLAVYVKDSMTDNWAASGARLLTDIGGVLVDSGNGFPSAFPPNQPAVDSQPLLGAGERAVYIASPFKGGRRAVVLQRGALAR